MFVKSCFFLPDGGNMSFPDCFSRVYHLYPA